jgi:ABC-type branched-subunit amino acid transport system substrate-binding protein
MILGLTASAQDRLKQLRSTVTDKRDGKEFYIHTVKRGQTLYMISKAYGVEVSDIIRENPEVKEGIRSEQKLWIPAQRSAETAKKSKKAVTEETETVKPAPPPEEEDLPCESPLRTRKSAYNVALMMPLYLGEVDQIDVEGIPGKANPDVRPFQFIEFYEGFRMALDSLKKSGISIQVSVYDILKDTVKTKRVLKDPELKKMDLIIGLLYNRPFSLVEEFAMKNKIPLVNPLSEREQIVELNPEVIKVQPSVKSQPSELAGYLSGSFPEANIIVLNNSQYSDKEATQKLIKALQEKNIEVKINQGYDATLEALSREKENVVIIFSENKTYALDLITKLNEWKNEYKITLVGLPRWDKFENIEVDYLVNLNTHILAPFFIDYEDPEVKKFVLAFQSTYQTDPDPMAFQGFDVAYYFITALARYGKSFTRCLPSLRMKSLQSDFRFSSTKGNGFVNEHWEIYRYENFFVRRAVIK